MEVWVFISIAAAFFQTLRFMLQKQLASDRLSATGATFARFLFAAPMIVAGVFFYASATEQALPAVSAVFLLYALTGGIAQILATVAVVALFAERNFAVGITFKKTEVILTALVGFLVLGDRVSPVGMVALLIGLLGVVFLSERPGAAGNWVLNVWNRAAGLGVLSGVFFAFSAVAYRAATLSLENGDVGLRASFSLTVVVLFQTVLLALWLGWKEPGQISLTIRNWRVTTLVGLTSAAGSLSWFTAFALQSAAYVFAVGQIEVIFGFLVGIFVFHERSTARELIGIVLLTVSILGLIVLA